MTKEVTSAPIRPTVLAGAGAMLAVALGGFALVAPIGAAASTEAAMLATEDRRIADAVAAAEAEGLTLIGAFRVKGREEPLEVYGKLGSVAAVHDRQESEDGKIGSEVGGH